MWNDFDTLQLDHTSAPFSDVACALAQQGSHSCPAEVENAICTQVACTAIIYFNDHASCAISEPDPRSEGYDMPTRLR
jgi:hypothetical protein